MFGLRHSNMNMIKNKIHIWDFFQSLHLSCIKLASKYCGKTENYGEKSTELCMTCVCLFFQLTVVIMNGHFHEKLISFRLFHLPKQFDVCSFWELIGSLLSVCGRQRPERKKRFISFQGQLGLRNPQAVRKCNCFSPYCAKTSMNFSIKILTIYRTKYLMMNACIMSFEQVERWNLRWISNDFCWYCNQILNFGTPSFL